MTTPKEYPMKRFPSSALVLFTLAIAGSSLVACAGASSGPAEVRFHLSKPEAIPYFRDLIKEYNASQDEVEVVFDTSSNLQAGFLRGNPPDL